MIYSMLKFEKHHSKAQLFLERNFSRKKYMPETEKKESNCCSLHEQSSHNLKKNSNIYILIRIKYSEMHVLKL